MPAPLAALGGRAALMAGRVVARRLIRSAMSRGGGEGGSASVSIRRQGSTKGLEDAVVGIGSSLGELSVYLPDEMHVQPGHNAVPIGLVLNANENGVVGADGWRIPPRPALGSAIANNQDSWLRSARARLAMAVRGRTNLTTTIRRLGKRILDDIERSFSAWSSPANAPSTVRKKGFNDPLEETGALRKAFRFLWTGRPRVPRQVVAMLRRLDRIG